MKDSKMFAYPCEFSSECPDFLEGAETMSFAEFCETVCGSGCPDCVFMDVPYTKEMYKNGR